MANFNSVFHLNEKIETELEEIRQAYTPAERATILHQCLANLAEESAERDLSTQDILDFLRAARNP